MYATGIHIVPHAAFSAVALEQQRVVWAFHPQHHYLCAAESQVFGAPVALREWTAYYLYQMLLLQEYIQDPVLSEALQAAQEEFDYSCFQPSWGEKGRRLFPYSLHLGEYSSNQVSDNVEDLRLAMKEYVEWMNAHFAVKWKHSCGVCHVVDSEGQEYNGAVMAGKVMGHLLCRVIGCNLDIRPESDPELRVPLGPRAVVDEEDAEPPVLWPALYLPDRNVVIPAVHREAIVSMFKHEKHGTRMWHSGKRRFVEAAELAAEADTRKRRISLILADGMETASWAVQPGQIAIGRYGNRFCKLWVEQCAFIYYPFI
ncbi:hypothetical protein BDR26DRAFT_940447 [Obelidium mucronatum]|nr:hypothetical protein BDR26DRAFT_940447 [Obelidium mucronatum]